MNPIRLPEEMTRMPAEMQRAATEAVRKHGATLQGVETLVVKILYDRALRDAAIGYAAAHMVDSIRRENAE